MNNDGSIAEKKSVNSNKKGTLGKLLNNYGMVLIMILMVAVFGIVNPNFLLPENLLNILRQISIYGIMAAGMTMVLLCGEIDLSVGSVVAFTGVVAALMVQAGSSMFVAVVAGTLVGALIGVFNGVLTVKFKIPSFLITMGSTQAIRGIGYVITDGRSIGGLPDWFSDLGTGHVWVIPTPIIVMIVIMALAYIFLEHTQFGRYFYAVGGNKEAAKLSGINSETVVATALIISSAMAGLSGVIWASRLSSGQPIVGTGYEMQVIASCVIGGTSLAGGRGKVLMSLLGAVLLGILYNGLNLLRVSPYWQLVATGLIIIVAVIIDGLRNFRKAD